MTLFTSNFKALSIAGAVIISVGLLLATEAWFVQYNQNPYQIRDQINAEKPDIIMLGNSMLGANVDQALFDRTLTRFTKRPIHSTFISYSGKGGDLFYVILKQQIASSGVSGVPVGIVGQDDSFTITGNNVVPDAIKRNLVEYDPVFFKKYQNSSLKYIFPLRKYFATLYYSPGQAVKIRDILLERFNLQGDAIIGWWARFSRNNDPYNAIQTPVAKGINKSQIIRNKAGNKDMLVNESFVPDMLQAAERFNIFFVSTSSFRKSVPLQNDPGATVDPLADYLKEKSIKLIITNEFNEMRYRYLFLKDGRHLTPKGKALLSFLLARKIFEEGLIK